MSRVSINRRLDRIREVLLPPGSLEWRIDRLPENLKQAHLLWRERCDAITFTSEKHGDGALYEMMLAGDDVTPPMPFAVERALWPGGKSEHRITTDMPLREIADAYTAMLEEGSER